jgi:hypothetical protein
VSPERQTDPDFASGRRRKVGQFLTAAEEIMDLAGDAADVSDAYVTLCVHAGIAAADTMCAHQLGRYTGGDNHHEASHSYAALSPTGTHWRGTWPNFWA